LRAFANGWLSKREDPRFAAFSCRGLADKPRWRVGIISRRLFAINWADTAPGVSWLVEYRAMWLPIYDRWVVTASADGDDAFGYPDFALGSFSHECVMKDGAGEIIRRDWPPAVVLDPDA
jgi:hypothetical protein